MVEQRKSARYETSARVIVQGIRGEEALLRDISITGCRVEAAKAADIEPNKRYRLKILPEGDAEIDSFFLVAECKWAETDVESYGFGFNIIESPKGKQFQRYVDYLSWRYAQGNSMTKDMLPGSL